MTSFELTDQNAFFPCFNVYFGANNYAGKRKRKIFDI